MTLTQQFETQRDLVTGMLYKRGETSVVERFYTYDNLGRPLTRQQNRQGGSRNDSFTHNDRRESRRRLVGGLDERAAFTPQGRGRNGVRPSQLTAGILGIKGYYYSYDNIGNRKTAKEDADEATSYDANALNQYTVVGDFEPEFDATGKAADGCKADWTHAQRAPRRGESAMGRARINQTKVQTCTGIWNVTYNAKNRPVTFERSNEDGTTTRVTCAYDYMGRRTTKKVETIAADTTATTLLHQRYIYRGYLQIAGFDLTESGHSFRWFITWDPTQPVATRPLAIRKDGTWYCYGWDLTKNVCEVFSNEGRISNTVIYSYTPYGAVSAEGSVQQPIQWSSEFNDDELGLVYYNYRYYNPKYGRWDELDSIQNINLYAYSINNPIFITDLVGRKIYWSSRDLASSPIGNHHYLLFVYDTKEEASQAAVAFSKLGNNYKIKEIKSQDKCKKSKWVLTLALFKGKDGKIDMQPNNADDIKSYEESYLNETKWYKNDFDYEGHEISPINGMSEYEFTVKLIENYKTFLDNINTKLPDYSLFTQNCATFVSGFLGSVGFSMDQRKKLGDFQGVDRGYDSDAFDKYFTSR